MSKTQPILTDESVYFLIRSGLEKAVSEEVQKTYSNPIGEIVRQVIVNNQDEIRSVVCEMISSTISDKEFRKILKEELRHKVAKSLVSQLEGAIEKSVNVYKQDQVLKSKMILALENIIKENQNDQN